MPDGLPLLGFGLPVAGNWATPASMLTVARRAEQLGYSSLWTFQRLLSPISDHPAAGSGDARDPAGRGAGDPAYRAVHDPLLPLALVAGATTRIRLGTATVCAPFTAPALLARSLTTLDVLCGGRLTVGLGLGWSPQEYAAAGVPFAQRGARFEEYLRCLQALWTQDPVEFAGACYTVPRSRRGLAPVQRPQPPLLLGGSAPAALRRAGRLAQGWIASSGQDLATIGEPVQLVRDGARAAGRDPQAVQVLVRGLVELLDEEPDGPRRPLRGTREQVRGDLRALRAQGVTEVFFDLNFAPEVAAPGADPAASVALAERVLEAFAPAAPSPPVAGQAQARRRPPSA